jgi:GT2 family glycosyltransferase
VVAVWEDTVEPVLVDVSIVVVSWNTAVPITAALDSLPAAIDAYTSEVIVVDNASTDGSVELLTARGDCTVMPLDTNTGFTHAANVGARAGRGRYVLFLNPDIVARSGSIAQLIAAVDATPTAYGATPWFVNPDGSPQYFWRRIPGGLTVFFCMTRLGKLLDRVAGRPVAKYREYRGAFPAPPDAPTPIDGVGAACLLVRREEFLNGGGFDNAYRNFFQDAELERTMKRRGRELLAVGSAVVEHERGVTLKTLAPGALDSAFRADAQRFLGGAATASRIIGTVAFRLDAILNKI